MHGTQQVCRLCHQAKLPKNCYCESCLKTNIRVSHSCALFAHEWASTSQASCRECAELVRTKDTGTLQYEQCFNSDETECIVIERYRDLQASLNRRKNLGDNMAVILRICSGSGEGCGTPRPELM
jgi:hypothetical protein